MDPSTTGVLRLRVRRSAKTRSEKHCGRSAQDDTIKVRWFVEYQMLKCQLPPTLNPAAEYYAYCVQRRSQAECNLAKDDAETLFPLSKNGTYLMRMRSSTIVSVDIEQFCTLRS